MTAVARAAAARVVRGRPDPKTRGQRATLTAKLHAALSASRRAEARYVRDLLKIVRRVHEGVMAVVDREVIAPDEVRRDDVKPRLGIGDRLVRKMFRYVDKEVGGAHDRMAGVVDRGNAAAVKLVGIRPTQSGLASIIAKSRTENIALIQKASLEYADQVRAVLEDPDNFARRPESLRDRLVERGQVSESRAMLIARDQTTKLNGDINRHRQVEAGVDRFRWSTSHDERVRPAHAELDGRVFDWAEGLPADVAEEVDEEEGATPGSPIMCRCVGAPYLPELEGEDDEEPPDEEPEQAAPAPEPEREEPAPPAEAPRPAPLDLAKAFSRVEAQPGAHMFPEDVVSGLRHDGVARFLEATQPELVVATELTSEGKGVEGYWQSNGRTGRATIAIKVNDIPAPPPSSSSWGFNWRVADTRGTRADKIRSSFIHETGHHVHLGSDPAKGVDKIVRDAFAKHRPDGDWPAAERQVEILKHGRRSPAISAYAMKNSAEYFAESFSAYIEVPNELAAHDPGGYAMVRQVLQILGIE